MWERLTSEWVIECVSNISSCCCSCCVHIFSLLSFLYFEMRLECLVLRLQDQYRFCYELVQSYLDEFATYANFRWETLPSHSTADVQIIVCLTDCVTCAVLLTKRVIYVNDDCHGKLLRDTVLLILTVGRVMSTLYRVFSNCKSDRSSGHIGYPAVYGVWSLGPQRFWCTAFDAFAGS